MKNLLFISIVSFVFLFSCSKEGVAPKEENSIAKSRALPAQTNVSFVASQEVWHNSTVGCLPGLGTCSWNPWDDIITCDIPWMGDIESGLNFIEEMEDADALFNIETYDGRNIIGFRFKGFSSSFLEQVKANDADESIFQVSETIAINKEATEILGYNKITIQSGKYPFFIDEETGEKVVYINADLE